jgi:hypothetical protein
MPFSAFRRSERCAWSSSTSVAFRTSAIHSGGTPHDRRWSLCLTGQLVTEKARRPLKVALDVRARIVCVS